MRSLLLLRHAKSSHAEPGLGDHERPLTPRGRRAAALMGTHIAEAGLDPSRILCSTARRTRETLEELRPQLLEEPTVAFESLLYLASERTLLALVREVEDAEASVLVIAHNPGIADLAVVLAGSGDTGTIDTMTRKFPTAALAALRFDVESWKDVAPRGGHLIGFTTPRNAES